MFRVRIVSRSRRWCGVFGAFQACVCSLLFFGFLIKHWNRFSFLAYSLCLLPCFRSPHSPPEVFLLIFKYWSGTASEVGIKVSHPEHKSCRTIIENFFFSGLLKAKRKKKVFYCRSWPSWKTSWLRWLRLVQRGAVVVEKLSNQVRHVFVMGARTTKYILGFYTARFPVSSRRIRKQGINLRCLQRRQFRQVRPFHFPPFILSLLSCTIARH